MPYLKIPGHGGVHSRVYDPDYSEVTTLFLFKTWLAADPNTADDPIDLVETAATFDPPADPETAYKPKSPPLTAALAKSPYAIPLITFEASLTRGQDLAPISIFEETFFFS
jgi:hypothetical protein